MMDSLTPDEEEVSRWLIDTVKHSCHVEYFLDKLGFDYIHFDRPHDLFGKGNKFDWDILKGFSLQYREPKVDFNEHISPALEKHREQYHHQKWNYANPKNKWKHVKGASENDLILGAVDSICSLLENRHYQGRSYQYHEIFKFSKTFLPHQIEWVVKILPKMMKLRQPKIDLIDSIYYFPNIGLEKKVYEEIFSRLEETVKYLREDKGYLI